MSSFAPEFMKVQEEMLELNSKERGQPVLCKEELGTESYDYLVDLPQEQDVTLKAMIDDVLSTYRLPSPPPPPADQEEVDKSRGIPSPDTKFIGKSPLGGITETNSLSDVWRMLEAQSTSNGFPVSPMGYNVFDDGKRVEWAKREAGTWGEQEASRTKVSEWLKKL